MVYLLSDSDKSSETCTTESTSNSNSNTSNCTSLSAQSKPSEVVKRHLPIGVAILPIGTGNDLAIELGWGQCYMNEPLAAILERILLADKILLDRWELQAFSIPEMTRQESFSRVTGNCCVSYILFIRGKQKIYESL